jgi:hypothetical protein
MSSGFAPLPAAGEGRIDGKNSLPVLCSSTLASAPPVEHTIPPPAGSISDGRIVDDRLIVATLRDAVRFDRARTNPNVRTAGDLRDRVRRPT